MHTSIFPASFQQEGVWYHALNSGTAYWNFTQSKAYSGRLDIVALDKAIDGIIRRHSALRTHFRIIEDALYQVVDPVGAGKNVLVHLKFETDDKAFMDGVIRSELSKEGRYEFNYENEALIRFKVLEFKRIHFFILTINHIVTDSASMQIFWSELINDYNILTEGGVVEVSLPVGQYFEYSVVQHDLAKSEAYTAQKTYWLDKFAGGTPVLNFLFNDGKTDPVMYHKEIELPAKLVADIRTLALRRRVLQSAIFQAAYYILLRSFSQDARIAIGNVVNGRGFKKKTYKGVVGLFAKRLVNIQVIRGDDPVILFLDKVNADLLASFENSDVPYEELARVLNERDKTGLAPLCQAVFNMLRDTGAGPGFTELEEYRDLDYENDQVGDIQYDIGLSVIERNDHVKLRLDLKCSRDFVPVTDFLALRLVEILHACVYHAHVSISDLDILSGKELVQLRIFNETTVAHPVDKTMVDLLEEQAARTPDHVALLSGQERVRYRELADRSNQLGHYLRRAGVREGSLVGICMERSVEMVIGILGILKAGGAYIPIDPAYPRERVLYMLDDTEARVVLSSKKCRGLVEGSPDTLVVPIDELSAELGRESKEHVKGRAPVNDGLTYVIYTSGSTGRPKGVQMPEKALLNLLWWHERHLSDSAHKRVLQFASISFDVSFQEIFSVLCFGGSLVLIGEETRMDMAALISVIERHGVTQLFIPYVVLKSISEYAYETGRYPSCLREIFTAGEQLKLNRDMRELSVRTGLRLFNYYGPSEAHVVTSYEVMQRDYDERILPPIGRPIDNTQIYILDVRGKLCGIGAVGEIYIGGVQVARGYLKRPELTAVKFIANPFSEEEACLYRTGDIGAWLPDGNIVYLGRQDDQVKIRGYRVEPGEIEGVVQQSGLVRQSVVVAVDDGAGSRYLVGYVVVEGHFDREKLIGFLRERLPEYMVPVFWVQLEKIPLTQSGKVDKLSLPAFDGRETEHNGYVEPRDEPERAMAIIWQELLRAERIGIRDNFFALGGHSLLANRIVSLIRKQLNIEISIRDIFTYPSIAQLSTYLRQREKGPALRILSVQARPDRIPLSFSQERLWFIDQMEGSVPYHIPWVMRLKGRLNADALSSAFREVVNRHEVLRTVIYEELGVCYQQIMAPGLWQLYRLDGQRYEGDPAELQTLIEELVNKPFDLSADHMLRVHLISFSEREHIMVMNLHHIAADGWSWDILGRELTALYSFYDDGRPLSLPALPVQYADYALWQRRWLQGAMLNQGLNYWRAKLAKVAPLELPMDYIRLPVQRFRGDNKYIAIDTTLSKALQALSQRSGVTLFMTLLAAFKVLLYRYTGQEDICVGSPVAGRTLEEIEGLIGFFVNTLALRSDLSGNPVFRTFLESVKQTTLEAYEHQETPFEKVVEAVVSERDLSRSPLFQVMFAMQHASEGAALHLGEVLLTDEQPGSKHVKFDLTLTIMEREAGLACYIAYNRDLFMEETIGRMLGHYVTLLRSIAEAPEQRIRDLPMLSGEEERVLLVEFNDTAMDYPRDKTLVDLLAEQAARTPELTALLYGIDRLSYRELEERSNQVGHYLRALGVQEESLVGICMERSVDMLIGVLGILKAGGAYVPLDPQYPREWIGYILSDIAAKVVLSSQESRSALPSDLSARMVLLDEEWGEIGLKPTSRPDTSLRPDHLAYVIYTSGSTGRPKGVMIEHHSLADLSTWQKAYFKLDETKKISQMGSFSFDASVGECVMALSNGCTLVMIDKDDFSDLPGLINRYGIDVVVSVPSLLRQLNPAEITRHPMIVSVGEKCTVALYEQWKNNCHFINGFGPTEYTVYSHAWHGRQNMHSIPIGKSRANLRTYIVDEEMHLSPIGVDGEICLSGPGTGRGYFKDKARTMECFCPNPFYLDTLYTDKGALIWIGDMAKGELSGEETAIAEEISSKVDAVLPAADVMTEIDRHFEGNIKAQVMKMLRDNEADEEFRKGFLRYYYEGMYDTYKTESLPWEVFLGLYDRALTGSERGVDLGCGSGELIRQIYGNGIPDISGVDINPYFIERLREKNINGIIARIDTPAEVFLKETGLKKGSMDFVLSTLTLDRVQHPGHLVKNMSIVLKEGGRFILGTLLPIIEYEDGSNRSAFRYTKYENKLTPGKTEKEDKYYLLEELVRNGISVIEVFTVRTRVRSKNGVQDYEVYFFCGDKQIPVAGRCDHIRMYRTGDLGRWLSDGNIAFTGRRDDQIKIRGCRIEPGEIERVLQESGLVKQSMVLAHEGNGGSMYLVGYIIPAGPFNRGELVRYLQGKLPEYMIPGSWVPLSEFPLNQNGKVDKRSLPAVDGREQSGNEYVAPGAGLQSELALIWQDLLAVERVGIRDNFFALGGHSLLVMQLIATIKKQFGLKIPIKTIFRFPCIEDLAEYITFIRTNDNAERNSVGYEVFEL